MQRKHRARRHAMAVAHSYRLDARREAESGLRASDRRRVLKAMGRERRGAVRALEAIVKGLRREMAR